MRRWTVLLAALSISLIGCARGTKYLGRAELLDGSIIEGIQHKSLGHSGPNVTRIESWRYSPETNKSEFVGESSGHASGAVETAIGSVGNAVPAAVGGVLAIEAARALRPSKTDVNVNSSATASPTQTGASATASPTQTGASATASPTQTGASATASPTQTNTQTGATAAGGTVIANPSTTITGSTSSATGGAGGSAAGGAGGTATNTNTNQNCGGTTVNSSCN